MAERHCEIVWCPLHENAAEMLLILKRIIKTRECECSDHLRSPNCSMKIADDIIRRASQPGKEK